LTHVFFDLDGTLTDPAPGIEACFRHAAAALGRPLEGDLTRFIGPPLRDCFREILATDDDALVEEGVRRYRERFATVGLFENAVHPGMPDTLARLRADGLVLCVVTSKVAAYADRIIDHFGLREHLPVVYGAEMDGTRSEKAELIAHALREEGAEPSRACMVGDRAHDIVGARAHGLASVGVLWGYGSADELRGAGADRLVGEVKDLRDALLGMASP
jgi:phosphoglycolate phosphatase